MIYSIIEKVKEKFPENAVKNVYAKEIHSNIAFNILLAMLCSLLLIIYSFDFNTNTLLSKLSYSILLCNTLHNCLLWFN